MELAYTSESTYYGLTTDIKAQLEGLSYEYLACFKSEELNLMHWHDDQLRILKNTSIGEHQVKKDFTLLPKIKAGLKTNQEIQW